MVKKYQDYIEEKKANLRIVNNLKVTNGFRSLLDVYQQKAEYESRLKVQRMERDMELKNFLDDNELPDYERYVKVVNQEKGDENKRESEKEVFSDFFSRSKNLLDMYYKEVHTKDQLESLTDKDLIYSIRETPTKIKKQAHKIFKLLESNNITIEEDGTLDYSGCTNELVRRKIQSNPLVRYAILNRDLDYGFTHLETRREQGDKIRRDIMVMRSQDAKREEEETREQRELELRMQVSQSEIDKLLEFNTAGGSQKNLNDDSSSDKHLNPTDLIEGTEYRLDKNGALMESFPERMLRLERKWLFSRGARSGDVEQETEEEFQKKLESITEKIRRIKLQLERQALGEAQSRLFEEHSQLSVDELMAEQVPIERLLNYYSLPVDQRQPGLAEDIDFSTIRGLVRRRELVEDLAAPFDNTYKTQLRPIDSEEALVKRIRGDKSRRAAVANIDKVEFAGSLAEQEDQSLREATLHKQRFLLAKQEKAKKKTVSISQRLQDKASIGDSIRQSLGLSGDHDDNDAPDNENRGLKSKKKIAAMSPKIKGNEKKDRKNK